ncbi:MAG: ATP-binding protein, partial [Eubacterium sp.]|nr:ATP-binding protein [Eubacterium sp.]
VHYFFSIKYAGKSDLFEHLSIWKEEKYKNMQGSYPVLFISFADVKETTYLQTRKKICNIIKELYYQHLFLLEKNLLSEDEKKEFRSVSPDMEDYQASGSIKALCGYLSRYYGKKVIILLDEYDTPMQEAYMHGFWRELVSFTRSMFNSAFKTNPYLERAIMTGITRVSKESVFSDLNNLEVVTATSRKYADSFGFTQEEVFAALDEFCLADRRQAVKNWYDGFTFGNRTDIYNPWSILNFLDKKQFAAYWANSSSNHLAGKLIQRGSKDLKADFERLLQGSAVTVEIDEQIVYDQLDDDEQAAWSFLLASGYLKVRNYHSYMSDFGEWREEYQLALTNFEVRVMFRTMIRKWFAGASCGYNDFIKALLADDVRAMNAYMNKIAMRTFSYFDTGKNPSDEEPERFYHGFVLGLMVDLADRYVLTSNRESGFGRYDVMLEPRDTRADGIILEFKVQDTRKEKRLLDTVKNALEQIEQKEYGAILIEKGIPRERIRKYGFAFRGKEVLIGGGNISQAALQSGKNSLADREG